MESVWVFNKNSANFSGGVFSELELAENWRKDNSLSGILSEYPLNQDVFD
jgi:hypothetical protein